MRFNDKELGAWASVFSADKEGLLEKKGAGRGQGYRQRWFRLKGNLLFYFKVDELGGWEEQSHSENLESLKQSERERFDALGDTILASHEKERAQSEKMKYYSRLGSVVGAIVGFAGSNFFLWREVHTHQRLQMEKMCETMKDPAVVGHYDTLLTFADRKAERFFATHDFSDDPILTAKYREMVDQWENSSLMAYIPPFSGNETSNMAALTLCEDSYKNWRHTAIASYCEQLSSMQRLRHEVMLLHSKLESREAEIERLKQQLVQAEREKSVTELEFSNYRKHTQKLLCESVVDKTQKWLESSTN